MLGYCVGANDAMPWGSGIIRCDDDGGWGYVFWVKRMVAPSSGCLETTIWTAKVAQRLGTARTVRVPRAGYLLFQAPQRAGRNCSERLENDNAASVWTPAACQSFLAPPSFLPQRSHRRRTQQRLDLSLACLSYAKAHRLSAAFFQPSKGPITTPYGPFLITSRYRYLAAGANARLSSPHLPRFSNHAASSCGPWFALPSSRLQVPCRGCLRGNTISQVACIRTLTINHAVCTRQLQHQRKSMNKHTICGPLTGIEH